MIRDGDVGQAHALGDRCLGAGLGKIQRRQLLSEPAQRDLDEALAELRIIEDRIVKKQRRLIPAARLESLRKKLMAAVLEIEQRGGAI